MKNIVVQKYLERNLGIVTDFSVAAMPKLPHFARRQFDFFMGALFEKNICLLIAKKEKFQDYNLQELESISQIVCKQNQMLGVFVFQRLSKQERLMLIKRGIPFIVPDTQMFLPQLGMDLFDRIPDRPVLESSFLRPAAQGMLLEQLLTGSLQGLSVNKASQIMGYTAMGTLRAADQLNALHLCEVSTIGRSKILNFSSDRKQLWEDAARYLRNPVRKTIAVENDSNLKNFPFAGEYALSRHSDLSVSRKCYAMHQTAFKSLFNEGALQISDHPADGVADIQIWFYTLPSWQEEVDPLSLELSFLENTDPRIKIALLELKEHQSW